MKTITPLLRFLRELEPDQKKQFAKDCGTTLLYLYQIAAQKEPNPTLRLAFAIVKNSHWYGSKAMAKPLTLEDLIVGAEEVEDNAKAKGQSKR